MGQTQGPYRQATEHDLAEQGRGSLVMTLEMDPEENDRLGNLLKIPFQEYRPPKGAKFDDYDLEK